MSESNGTAAEKPPTARERLRELRAQKRALQEQLEIRQLEHALRMTDYRPVPGAAAMQRHNANTNWRGDNGQPRPTLESVQTIGAVGDWVQGYVDLLDRYRDGDTLLTPISTPNDRKYGRNFPIFQTETELALLRGPARILCASNSYAIGLMGGLTSYVIGTGFKYRVQRKDDKADDGLAKKCQDILDEFTAPEGVAAWPELEQELFWRSREDGEFFLWHDVDDKGQTWVRTVEPEQILQPPQTEIEHWLFGIRTDPEDVQTIHEYHVAWLVNPLGEGHYLTPDNLIHCKINTKRSIKRGLTDFCFDTYSALSIASKLRRNMSEGGAVQAAIAGIREHDTASQQQVQSFQQGMVDYQTADMLTGRLIDQQKMNPGTIWDMPKGVRYVPPPMANNSEAHVDILQACLRGASIRWNAPEWLGSGLHDTSSFASSLTAESPFVKTVGRQQQFYAVRFLRVMWAVLTNAVRQGRLPRDIYQTLTIQVEPPTLATRDPLQEAQANAIRIQNKWKSPQQVANEEGLDWQQVQADWDEYNESNGTPGLPLTLPGEDEGKPKDPTKPPPAPTGKPTTEAVTEGVQSVSDLIEVPDVRQTDPFSCGAAAAMSVGRYYGVGPETLDEWKTALGTTPENGTEPANILKILASLGLTVQAKDNLTIDDLRRYHAQGMPVITPVQDYGPAGIIDQDDFDDGHYLTVIGVALGQVFCQDSSEDNVIADSGSIQRRGRIMVPLATFDEVWHDRGSSDEKFIRYGIAVGGGKKDATEGRRVDRTEAEILEAVAQTHLNAEEERALRQQMRGT